MPRRTAQKIQRLQNKLPDLDYLSWADRGMPRPETYTVENLTDYAPRIGQLANYPGKPTKTMQREAKEVEQDKEGLRTMRVLGHNMAYLLKCLEAGKAAGVTRAPQEPPVRTNFIR